MGLLSRIGRAGAASLRDTGLPGVPLGNAALGGVAGGIMGAGGSPYDHSDGGHGVEGALLGAALGGGLGLIGGGRQAMRNFGLEMSHGVGSALNDLKKEALRYVRDPRLQQRVMQSESAEEIQQIVQHSVSTSRSRLTDGGF